MKKLIQLTTLQIFLSGCAPAGTIDIGRCYAIMNNTTNSVGTRYIKVEITKYNEISNKFLVVQPHGIRWTVPKFIHNMECRQ